MSRFKYELKCKLDRLNEEMKSWIKQVDYAIRLWSRLPDSTLYESYEQVLTLMYRKLVSNNTLFDIDIILICKKTITIIKTKE